MGLPGVVGLGGGGSNRIEIMNDNEFREKVGIDEMDIGRVWEALENMAEAVYQAHGWPQQVSNDQLTGKQAILVCALGKLHEFYSPIKALDEDSDPDGSDDIPKVMVDRSAAERGDVIPVLSSCHVHYQAKDGSWKVIATGSDHTGEVWDSTDLCEMLAAEGYSASFGTLLEIPIVCMPAEKARQLTSSVDEDAEDPVWRVPSVFREKKGVPVFSHSLQLALGQTDWSISDVEYYTQYKLGPAQ